MAGPAWYSGKVGISSLVAGVGGMIADYRKLSRGFRRGMPRPASWPERSNAVPDRPTDLGWARTEPVRSIRYALQKGMLIPFTEVMARPTVEGEEWVQELDRPVILASNHTSHADTPLLLYALGDRVRERTVVAAAADYFYNRRLVGFLTSLWLNTFPFSRTGSPREVLHRSSQLLKSGWNLLVFPEGTRSPNGALQEFTPGVGHLATENRVDVIPMHLRGAHRIMPKGRDLPLPARATIRIGKPLKVAEGETSRSFADRVEKAVHALADGTESVEVTGSWIDRWNATRPRATRR
ncbi:MAG TPA: lysophospholipid acyltransferase family protein [Candidatus Dormibacteraeota bacterium]|jgi:1-acyl-sn-glycerol-3-phosphate acyltransferase